MKWSFEVSVTMDYYNFGQNRVFFCIFEVVFFCTFFFSSIAPLLCCNSVAVRHFQRLTSNVRHEFSTLTAILIFVVVSAFVFVVVGFFCLDVRVFAL